MYKLILVDDEEEVRKGIIKKINWESYNFETPLEAENGRDALELIEDSIPDVVITDITMPIMDGLTLVSVIKQSYPTVKTAILTGFDDFKFAQQAIKSGVTDYVLKPVLPQDINDLIQKLKDKIDGEIDQKEDIIKLRRNYVESLPILREKFLIRLITGNPNNAEINKQIKLHNLCLNGNSFVVAAADIDASSLPKCDSEDDDEELCKFAVLNITREIIAKYFLGEGFFHNDNLVIIAVSSERDKTVIVNRTLSVLEEIRYTVKKYLKITISIGLGSIVGSMDKLRDSYRNALSALEYKLLIGSNRIIYIEDVEPQTTENLVFDEAKEQMLISSIKFSSEEGIEKAVKILFKEISSAKASLKDYQLYFLEVLSSLSKLSRIFQLDIGEILGIHSNVYAELYKCTTMDEISDWIRCICLKLNNSISNKMQNKTQMLLEKAKDYIDHNFSDDTLSLQKLADHLHISECYLSMIFKREANETFLKYLIKVRLDAAKELLGNSDLQIAEIAEKAGYPDISYFSFFFKKNTGMSPREYRKKVHR